MKRIFLMSLLLAACNDDETVSGYGASDIEWSLTSLNGAAFEARGTLSFPKPGSIAGKAPCNHYAADQESPYPWFNVKTIAATKMACRDLASERDFFAALKKMTLSEVAGGTLILSTPEGDEMVFKAAISAP